MKIVKISPRGYCKGVVNAINIAKNTREIYPNDDIYILGMIVHNRYVSDALAKLNILTLDHAGKTRLELLDSIQKGIVIFTAHGVDYRVKQKAKEKGLLYVDASCSDVIKTQVNILNKIKEGYHILYIGKENHPEALACVSDHPNIHLISKVSDINQLNRINEKIYVTNQTTMSILEIQTIFDQIKKIYPDALIEEEICNATRLRQQAIINLEAIDLLIVVGDPLSNNSNKLKEIGLLHAAKSVIMIEDVSQLNESDLLSIQSVGITSGASTPTYLTNQVIEAIEFYNKNQSLPLAKIDMSKIL